MKNQKLCSGIGQFHTDKTKELNSITLAEIVAAIGTPTSTAKAQSWWFIPSTLHTRTAEKQRENGSYYAIWCDIDDHAEIENIKAVLANLLCDYWIYSSSSSTPECKKWRVIIPLAEPATPEQWQTVAEIINDKFELAGIKTDRVSQRVNQICYLPNKDPERNKFYEFHIEQSNAPLNWIESLKSEILEKENQAIAEKQRIEELQKQSRTKAQIRMNSGTTSPVDAFNAAYSVEQSLEFYGYKQAGKKWISPNSESGAAGVIVKGNKWISSHASDSRIGRQNKNGTSGDAFDLFKYYEHGNDQRAALKAAGDMFTTDSGKTINQQNQQNYKENQASSIDDFGACDADFSQTGSDSTHFIALNKRFYEPLLFPHITETDSGSVKILSTIENLEFLLKVYGITLEYDEILKRRSIVFAGHSTKGHDMEDESALMKIKSLCGLNQISPTIIELLPALFQNNTVNPIKNWILSKAWDGIDRKQQLFNSITVAPEDENYRNQALNVWLTQCVAAADNGEVGHALNPRAVRKFEIVLILQGGQGAKKTTWFNSLLPDSLRDYIKDGMHLDPTDKDTTKKCISTWLCELGEIDATFRKSDIARLKAFLSNQVDEIRLPYDRTSAQFKRRTSFCASVNSEQFLTDSTGSRRFIPVQVWNCNDAHGVDMQQLFAQYWHEYTSGAIWWTTADFDKEVRARNEKHNEISVIGEMVSEHFNVNDLDMEGAEHLTATQILVDSGIREPKRQQVKELTEFLQAKGFKFKAVKGKRGFSIAKLITVFE
jgi:hypothetical protein